MQRSVGGYVRGNLLISLLASIGAFAAMSVLGVPSPCRSPWRSGCSTSSP